MLTSTVKFSTYDQHHHTTHAHHHTQPGTHPNQTPNRYADHGSPQATKPTPRHAHQPTADAPTARVDPSEPQQCASQPTPNNQPRPSTPHHPTNTMEQHNRQY